MDLKKKRLLALVCSIVGTCGLVALFIATYLHNFSRGYTLLLFIAVVLAIGLWIWFYLATDAYKRSLQPRKKGTNNVAGRNRQQRRKNQQKKK